MNTISRTIFPLAMLCAVLVQGTVCLAADDLDVLCIYYPEWHVYPEWEAYYGKGTTEWQCVSNSVARFEGQDQPIEPIWGYYDESDPEIAAKEIALASDAGIDVFLYDWYWANRKPVQHEGLERGFMKARNRDLMKFAIMWAYHDRDIPFQSKFGHEKDHYLWKLAHTEEDFLEAFAYCAKTYFADPSYYRKDGRPFFSLYAAITFIKDMGGPAKARAALDKAQAIAKGLGLPPVHFNAMAYSIEYCGPILQTGFDSTSVYSINSYHHPETTVNEFTKDFRIDYAWMETIVDFVNRPLAKVSPLHIPLAVRGWDCTARCDPAEPYPWKESAYPYMGIFDKATPEKFERVLRAVKKSALEDPKKPGAVLINAWNEYTEGSWLVPDKRNGDAYLKVVKKVFGKSR